MSEKQRADVALVERGLCESRTKAQVSIMAGEVYVGTRRIDKASELISRRTSWRSAASRTPMPAAAD